MPASWRPFARWFRLRRRLWRWGRSATQKPLAREAPLRAQLFGADQMEAHGRLLAAQHRLQDGPAPELLLARLRENAGVLEDATTLLTTLVHDGLRITPAGEWLLDNYYLIEEQIRLARRHLPRGYSRELPSLAQGPSAGLPRVYDIAMEAVAHGDGRVDAETLTRLVAAYQGERPLKLGELWAIPIMLRLAVLENLRRISARIMRDAADHRLATDWGQALEAAVQAPGDMVMVLADMVRARPPVTSAFVAELMRRLQGRGAALAMPLGWIEQWVAQGGRNVEALVHGEGQKQAADQVSIRNSIGSLRFLTTMDWREFVETMSLVEQTLRQDPDGTYARMDFATRDHYRHVVERIARQSGAAEHDVARFALQAARDHAGGDDGSAHVGYYLIDDGFERLRADVAALGGGVRRVPRSLRRVPLPAYLVPIGLVTAGFAILLLTDSGARWREWGTIAALSVLATIVFSEMAIALVNWAATLLVPPRPLPRLDFSRGIASDARTLVVVPTLAGSRAAVDALVEGLEVRFLANRGPHLHFGLLIDPPDADQASLPGDAEVLAHAEQRIRGLNARYAPEHQEAGGDLFFLFQRGREWNPREGAWMARERKRGKLAALNRLLREGDAGGFVSVVGNTRVLGNVRYVITLDTDTLLPRDAARELAGTMAHPLNRPRVDPRLQRVARGYGILQPGVGATMSGRRRSRFARLFGSESGIDPYTRTVSDVYQDLFGEGSFIGKGIYDVAAFEEVLAGRLPDNRILSHDLLEGCYARAGVVSDVRLYEDHPTRYAADMTRRLRWVRGDWQLLPWLLPWVPRGDGRRAPNPLSWLSRGKLLDNLRRSLVPAAALALLLTGWALLPQPLAWTLWLACLWLLPVLLPGVHDAVVRPADMAPEPHLLQVGAGVGRALLRALVSIACLPYEAAANLGAIGRTLWRMAISRRRLLQWRASHEVERALAGRGATESWTMLPAALFSVAVGIALWRFNPAALPVALPWLLLWLAAPSLMAWLGQPPAPERTRLSTSDRAFLGRLARRTWAFFELHLRAEEHWLPPDNLQEHPAEVVAHRTSPTNIGLGLLSGLAAWDFGYLQADELAARTRRTLDTLERLERHRGHYYNWYDTRTLRPLPPRYVSTVDSGNLAGHLLTLRQGLLALGDAPVLTPQFADGLDDTLGVLGEEAARLPAPEADAVGRASEAFVRALGAWRAQPATTLVAAADALDALAEEAQAIVDAWPAAPDAAPPHWPRVLLETCRQARQGVAAFASPQVRAGADGTWPSLRALRASEVPEIRAAARTRLLELERLAHVAGQCSLMEYGFLYDPAHRLLSIGYDVDERRLDAAFYDLLASEARLGVFVAIAQGQLSQESWFALGRLLTEVDGEATLLSWSGSMFEYLMPQLVMPSYPDTLLDQTARRAVAAQIHYGRQREVPWGVSESGYNAVDAQMNYQYRAFGVPGLGLKRGLAEDLVIAPYAVMMATMVAPDAATANLRRMAGLGFHGRFGMYEAVDYTRARVPRGQDHALIRSYMAHHQGMGFLALDALLRDQPMQRRFVADPEFQATLLLLQERIPRTGVFHPHEAEVAGVQAVQNVQETRLRVVRDPDHARPEVQLLSNGRLHGMLSSAGGGWLKRGDTALSRWREDGTRDAWGQWCYLRDVDDGAVWSATHQPTCARVDRHEAIFSDAKVEYRCRRDGYDSHLEIAISPEDDIELRRLRIGNRGRRRRTVEITTYAEVVLAPSAADEAHPAFGNLFVQSEIVREKQALLCTRRPRAHDEAAPWLLHLVAVHGADVATISYETDRARFIGRGRTPRLPQALVDDGPLSDTAGSVLDPIVAIRIRIALEPDQAAVIDIVTGAADARETCIGLIDKYRDRHLADRVFDLSWTHSQVVRRQINASQADAHLYERMAGLVVYAHPLLRAEPAVLRQNRRGQPSLWGQAISGDLPIVVLQVFDTESLDLVRQMVRAHGYWRSKGLQTDLVIWNEGQTGYRQHLQEQILGMLSRDSDSSLLDRPGGIFVRPAQQLSQEERVLLQTVARVIVSDRAGSLQDQLGRQVAAERDPPPLFDGETRVPAAASDAVPATTAATAGAEPGLPPALPAADGDDPWPFDAAPQTLAFDNGTGGFSADGREYVILSREGAPTPAPWCNVIANPVIGTVVSESAAGYTWSENAHAFRLTPWHNDPVSDLSGEAYYLRDEETGRVWSPMPLPCRGVGAYRTRHGFGYSVYEHVEDGIASELWLYVGPEDAVKFAVLRLRNLSGRARRLTATGYVEWVLADVRTRSHMHLVSEIDLGSDVLTVRNPYNVEFEGRCAFFDADAEPDADDGSARRGFTADRMEFIGRHGSLAAPAALARAGLSGRTGPGLDPCAALQVPVTLAPGQVFETTFRLGVAADREAAIAMALRLRGSGPAHDALDAVRLHWLGLLGTVRVSTPDPALDLLANGWLMYQVLSSRCFGRSGYYQSGGAFGFRDQLQDTMASIHALPQLSREHLLRSAARQFPQGDVMHWWHPPGGRGVRTRCSDDYLWLPQAVCRYVEVTGDDGVLGEVAAFVEGRAVAPDEESYYDLPVVSGLQLTLYEHCTLALRRGASLLGVHGLPLIGTGDWNDGMNRVGEQGRGESVWLAFFLHDALMRFEPVARRRDDAVFARWCLEQAQALRSNLDAHAWDGAWYRRAWFDDGTPLGSHEADECRIDSISQSWAVLSGAGEPARARQAMAALDAHLVREEAGLIQLLDPPFDRIGQGPGHNDPGYIGGYVPGVRENGGQYTHAAVWAVMAFARLGDVDRAWALAGMINPIRHGATPEAVTRYRVEPYVMAADVYAVAPHVGRGGWTWYTGSAGWMYRLLVESLLGLDRRGDVMHLAPCVPADWDRYRLQYRFGATVYRIEVEQIATGARSRLSLDGVPCDGLDFPLADDGVLHDVALAWPRAAR